MKRETGLSFIFLALISLLLGLFFGTLGGFQFAFPEAISHWIPFHKTRPLHVSFVISWILLCAAGGVYYYLPQIAGKPLYSRSSAVVHFYLFLFTGIAIFISYMLGIFGGREYLEFPYVLSLPVFAGWLLFAFNFFRTVKLYKKMPVYLWQWATGSVFIIWTLAEAYLWLVPFFRDNIIRDITVQWKSYGAIIGSWNMLVYGTATYVMCKISNDEKPAHSPMVFFLYFLGFTNLLFNWGHHTYIVPAKPWIKHVSYFISMTELIILWKIIYDWRKTVDAAQKNLHHIAYRFLLASEWWILLNLILALLISVPAINVFTHGTHVTVAHAMGTTIGINTMILLASVFYIFSERNPAVINQSRSMINTGYVVTNFSLLVFWICLIAAGVKKGYLAYTRPDMPFRELMNQIVPYLLVFAFAGTGIFAGIALMIAPLLRSWRKLLA